eukprot:CAMPEP_0195518854 /NCGR_PEP_ID=MMETSP0794_2-20130614/13805_1 /TAXON_ID=515487 /ORGANISM="Stephanopyxis turris, Strain CCMP 815" /LENGTH=146 /DNA_ID=CAMNT_0040647883 /DNA_START=275 /DNA_END=715 /DNA_ORIENTATION=+
MNSEVSNKSSSSYQPVSSRTMKSDASKRPPTNRRGSLESGKDQYRSMSPLPKQGRRASMGPSHGRNSSINPKVAGSSKGLGQNRSGSPVVYQPVQYAGQTSSARFNQNRSGSPAPSRRQSTAHSKMGSERKVSDQGNRRGRRSSAF